MEINIIEEIGEAAIYEQLAEECCELGQAALKMARIIRGENPTPKKRDDAIAEFVEECSDVKCVMDMLVKPEDRVMMVEIHKQKIERWKGRIYRAKSRK